MVAKKEVKPEFPSAYGSHYSMVNDELTTKLTGGNAEQYKVLTDERGNYLTDINRLDSGMADTNRYASVECRHAMLALVNVDPNEKAEDTKETVNEISGTNQSQN